MTIKNIWGNWLTSVFARLCSQRGETPDTGVGSEGDSGPTDEMQNDPFTPASSEDDVTAQAESAQPQQEESFVDPSTLPPELKAHWSRMHQAYTKTREELKRGREAAQIIQRFHEDPQFAEQALIQRAAQLGYQVVRPGQNGQTNGGYAAQNQQGGQEYVEELQQTLKPELQWLAPELAPGVSRLVDKAIQQALQPFVQQQTQAQYQHASAEYDKWEAQLTEKYPHWVEHEDTMDQIRAWWQSPRMDHPQYGNKLEWLYKMATEQQSSVSQAVQRINQAGKNRSSFSHTPSHTVPNVHERVEKAQTDEEAWEIATKHGLEMARRRGG